MTRKHYEILFILRPLQEEQLGKIIENYRSMVTRDGDIHRFENCGLRPFAYMIDNLRRGYYILMNIECSVEVVQKIEKALRADESVLRFLLMVTKKRVTGVSPLSKSAPEPAVLRRDDKENKPAALKSESAAAGEAKEAKEKERTGETIKEDIKEDESANLESSANSEASEQEKEQEETEELDTAKEDAEGDTKEEESANLESSASSEASEQSEQGKEQEETEESDTAKEDAEKDTKEDTKEEESADLENTAENPKEKE